SARERLYISWVGRSINDNTSRPPSVLVAQLRDHLAAGWRLAGADGTDGTDGTDTVAALTVEHPLQPFSARYFPQPGSGSPLFSYACEWCVTAQADAGDQEPLAAPRRDEPLTLRELADFLKDPARAFFRQRLQVAFNADDPTCEDIEPFE